MERDDIIETGARSNKALKVLVKDSELICV